MVSYAQERGVLVIPEFDGPGHTNKGWLGWAGPDFGEDEPVICGDLRQAGLSGQLDPSNPFMYTVLEGLLEEVAGVFPAPFIHIGT